MSIICVYNNRDILEKYLLSSIATQTVDVEVVLVDNRDNKYTSAASALNSGAEKANGEYLVFCHQDINLSVDTWVEDTIELLEGLDNVGIVGVAGKISDSIVYSNILQGIPPRDVTPYKLEVAKKASTVDECLMIIPRSVFMDNPFDERTCPDWHLYGVDYVLSIKKKSYEAYLIPSVLEHASPGDSMSDAYYTTLARLQRKHFKNRLIRTCMGDWFTFIPVSWQRIIKKVKNY